MAKSVFTLAETAMIAGTTPGALRQLQHRELISFDDDDDIQPVKRGGIRILSRNTAFNVMIMARLIDCGMKADHAWALATRFSDIGQVQVYHEGELAPGQAPGRAPGELFPDGLTWIVADPISGEGQIKHIKRNASIFDVLTVTAFPDKADNWGRPRLVLDLNELHAVFETRVRQLIDGSLATAS